jgi:hypothetical protein
MPEHLALSRLSQWDDFEELYKTIHWFKENRKINELIVDLNDCGFLPAQGLLALITAARLWHSWTDSPVRLKNLQEPVHQYMERADLFTACGQWVKTTQPLNEHFERIPDSRTIMELTHLTSNELTNAHQVVRVRQRAQQILSAWLPNDMDRVDRLVTILAEIAENIIHSNDIGFALIQRYRDTTFDDGQYRIQIGISDLGIGIRQALLTSPVAIRAEDGSNLETDSDFIKRALDIGVTSRVGGGGLGLNTVRAIVAHWNEHFMIRSGTSLVRFDPLGGGTDDNLAYVPGTQIVVQVHS